MTTLLFIFQETFFESGDKSPKIVPSPSCDLYNNCSSHVTVINIYAFYIQSDHGKKIVNQSEILLR